MTYRNAVPVSNTVVGTLSDPKQPNAWYDISLTASQVQAHDGSRLAVALSSRTSDVLLINAREAGGSVAPQLVVSSTADRRQYDRILWLRLHS